MQIRQFKSAKDRREALEKATGIKLSSIGTHSLDDNLVENKNCENLIGSAVIPMGVAGPLTIQCDNEKKEVYIPLATTEGALIASISRGCKAITASGGAKVFVEEKGVTRGPVFVTKNLIESVNFVKWLTKNFSILQKIAEESSSYLSFKSFSTKIVGSYVFVRFSFTTGDAMGMNMATIATEKIAQYTEKQCNVLCLSLAGNYDVDKKPAWLNSINGRGIEAHAEITLSQEVLDKVLKTSPQAFFDVWLGKCMLGSAVSGSLGFNAHFANSLAALFTATGQDLAHVIEGSTGITTVTLQKNSSLSVSVSIPALMLGTIGGGTNLPTQKEALLLLDVYGNGKKKAFAEIAVGVVLAGEISLLASLATSTLATAHKKLGRGK